MKILRLSAWFRASTVFPRCLIDTSVKIAYMRFLVFQLSHVKMASSVILQKFPYVSLFFFLKASLTSLSTFSPTGFGETFQRKSTSFNFVIDLIRDTFNLKTLGEYFLGIEDIKFDFTGGFTYQQAYIYMQLKDFLCAGLLEKKDRFEGKDLPLKETLTPAALPRTS